MATSLLASALALLLLFSPAASDMVVKPVEPDCPASGYAFAYHGTSTCDNKFSHSSRHWTGYSDFRPRGCQIFDSPAGVDMSFYHSPSTRCTTQIFTDNNCKNFVNDVHHLNSPCVSTKAKVGSWNVICEPSDKCKD